jgi:hypothetical protein
LSRRIGVRLILGGELGIRCIRHVGGIEQNPRFCSR